MRLPVVDFRNRGFNISIAIIIFTVAVYVLQNISQLVFGYDFPAVWGAKINALILEGQAWRFLTPVFLHASVIHIGFNMYALLSIGPGLEIKYGKWAFIFLYFVSTLWGNTLSFLLTPNISLGASTAIFGLIAAQGVYVYKNRFLLGPAARPILINILMVILVNLALGLSPGIDNWGHLGGLAGGFFFAWFAGPSFSFEKSLFGPLQPDQKIEAKVVLAAAVIIPAVLITIKFFLI